MIFYREGDNELNAQKAFDISILRTCLKSSNNPILIIEI